MKVNGRKTEYNMVCERVSGQGHSEKAMYDFKYYMGSTVQSDGGWGREVKKRVQAGWNC